MKRREAVFAFALAVAGGLVTAGAAMGSKAAGFVVGGLLLAGWTWLVLSE